jgi:hypothetical protein
MTTVLTGLARSMVAILVAFHDERRAAQPAGDPRRLARGQRRSGSPLT